MFPVQIAKIENIVGKYRQFELAWTNSIPTSKKLFNLGDGKKSLQRCVNTMVVEGLGTI